MFKLRLCSVFREYHREKIERKNGKREKSEEMNMKFVSCLVIQEKNEGKNKEFNLYFFLSSMLTMFFSSFLFFKNIKIKI